MLFPDSANAYLNVVRIDHKPLPDDGNSEVVPSQKSASGTFTLTATNLVTVANSPSLE